MDAIEKQHAADVLKFVSGQTERLVGHVSTWTPPSACRGGAVRSTIRWIRRVTMRRRSSTPIRWRSAVRNYEELVQIASAEIDWLYEYIAESGYALVLTDASGIVLYEKTDPTLTERFAPPD